MGDKRTRQQQVPVEGGQGRWERAAKDVLAYSPPVVRGAAAQQLAGIHYPEPPLPPPGFSPEYPLQGFDHGRGAPDQGRRRS